MILVLISCISNLEPQMTILPCLQRSNDMILSTYLIRLDLANLQCLKLFSESDYTVYFLIFD